MIYWIEGITLFAAIIYSIRWYAVGRRYRGRERLDGKVVIVTGCNTGIGKEVALDLAKRGARVHMACRDHGRCETARLDIVSRSGNENVFNRKLDLGSMESVRSFVKEFLKAENRLDILINNAAIMPTEQQKTVDGLEMQFGVNHIGPFLLTNLLLDVLRRSAPSRVVVVSSTAHFYGQIDRDDLQNERKPYSTLSCYSRSKLANVLFMRSLSYRLYGSGVTVNALHPGVVRTELGRHLWWPIKLLLSVTIGLVTRSPEQGAQTTVRVAVDPNLEKVTGKYFDDCREKRMSDDALDIELAEWMWETSEQLTNSGQ